MRFASCGPIELRPVAEADAGDLFALGLQDDERVTSYLPGFAGLDSVDKWGEACSRWRAASFGLAWTIRRTEEDRIIGVSLAELRELGDWTLPELSLVLAREWRERHLGKPAMYATVTAAFSQSVWERLVAAVDDSNPSNPRWLAAWVGFKDFYRAGNGMTRGVLLRSDAPTEYPQPAAESEG